IVIVHPRQSIVYFDSLCGNPNADILNGICNFVPEHLKIISWNDWTLYIPQDVPSQIINNDVGGNCGVHVCTWAYIIASDSYTKFSEDDMSAARKGIAKCLANSISNKRIENKIIKSRQLILESNEKEIPSEKFNLNKLNKSENIPFHFENTVESAASLYFILKNKALQLKTRMQKKHTSKETKTK
ncbi:hypothetical protein ALC57_17639, partial [Trachymyrmex cornetzi]